MFFNWLDICCQNSRLSLRNFESFGLPDQKVHSRISKSKQNKHTALHVFPKVAVQNTPNKHALPKNCQFAFTAGKSHFICFSNLLFRRNLRQRFKTMSKYLISKL